MLLRQTLATESVPRVGTGAYIRRGGRREGGRKEGERREKDFKLTDKAK